MAASAQHMMDDVGTVPSGYGQSESGQIPDTWQTRPLGDLAVVSAGGTPNRGNPRYWNGPIPWITTSQIDFRTITEAEQFITEVGLRSSSAKLLPPGTLVMALYGQGKTRGKIGVLGITASTNQACAAITVRHVVSREYIFHYLASQYELIRRMSNIGNQENLNGFIVRSISVTLPPVPEQRAIAAALSDVDRLIGALDTLIAKKRAIKLGAMQQLLTGKTRLPGFAGEWETKRLGEVADLVMGQSPSSLNYNTRRAGLPLVRFKATPTLPIGRRSNVSLQPKLQSAGNAGTS